MYLRRIVIQGIRIVSNAELAPGKGVNIIYGKNGAGKTSVLESIYMLGMGRTFRSRKLENIKKRGADRIRVYGEVIKEKGKIVKIGIERGRGYGELRMDGEKIESNLKIAKEVILAIITPESHRILSGGPEQRRRIVDWAMFHVEQEYGESIKKQKKVLKQRNELLKGKIDNKLLRIWTKDLADIGEKLDFYRRNYIKGIKKHFELNVVSLLENNVNVEYYRGWPKDKCLFKSMMERVELDRKNGYTWYGPQKADIVFLKNGKKVKDIFSRGQSKLLISSIVMANVDYIMEKKGICPIILVDDINSELDEDRQDRLIIELAKKDCQVIITNLNSKGFRKHNFRSMKLFHVEHGAIFEVA